MKKQTTCIPALACLLVSGLVFTTTAFSRDWSGDIRGRVITCRVSDIQKNFLGIWKSFNVSFESGMARARFSCSGNPWLDEMVCLQSFSEGGFKVERERIQFNLVPGTSDAEYKVCAKIYEMAQFSLKESGPIRPH
jgi:hypothetical protein